MREQILQQAIADHLAGRVDNARKGYLRLLEMNPSDPDALYKLGLLAFQSDHHEVAAGYFRRVIEMYPQEPKLRIDLAHALMITGLDGAREQLAVALELDPNNEAALSLLGTLHIYDGDIDMATECLSRVVEINPHFGEAYAQLGSLVRTGKYEFTDEQISKMREIVEDESINGVDRSVVMYALAHHLDGKEQFDEAFAQYRAANEFRRKIMPDHLRFDKNELLQTVDKNIDVFSSDFIARTESPGHDTDKPVFIIGQMRSGTSLVEQIISSHSRVAGVGELNYLTMMVRFGLRHLNKDYPYPEVIRHIEPHEFAAPAKEYLENVERRAGPGDWLRISDKMPANFLHLGLAWLLFPNARVIHVRRNPLDSCLSMYFNNLQQGFTTDLGELGCYYRQYRKIMAHWEKVLPLKMKTVRYGDLVAEPDEQVRGLIEFLDLEWEPACLDFHESTRRVRTPSSMQVREPVHGRALQRWKHYEAHLEPLFEALGEDIMAEVEAESG